MTGCVLLLVLALCCRIAGAQMLLDPTGRHVIVTTPETVDIYDATGTNKVGI